MSELVAQYLSTRTNAWAPTTLRSATSSLRRMAPHLDGIPENLWAALQSKKPYTRESYWTLATGFWAWLVKNGHRATGNPYGEWREANAKYFKNNYVRRPATKSLSEALRLVQLMPDAELRSRAELLLSTGLRKSEPATYDGQNVVGKGGKSRAVAIPDGSDTSVSISPYKIWAALKQVGLTPHMLRKIFLTELASNGADVFELCEIAGWSSPTTAMSYVKGARAQERVRQLQSRMGNVEVFRRVSGGKG